MKTLKLKHDTFIRTFGPSEAHRLRNPEGILDSGDPIRHVQPIGGILKDYDKVEVSHTEIVGRGDWGKIDIEVIVTYGIKKYDDLSVQLVSELVMVPGVERKQTPPQ
jgi:hypothetical protein